MRVPGSRLWFPGAGFQVLCSVFRVDGVWFRAQGAGSRMQGSGFKVQGLRFRVQGSGFMVQGSWFRIRVYPPPRRSSALMMDLCPDEGFEGLRFRVQGLWVWGLGFGVWVLRLRVEGLGFGVWVLESGVWGLGFGAWGLGFGVRGSGVGVEPFWAAMLVRVLPVSSLRSTGLVGGWSGLRLGSEVGGLGFRD